MRAYCYYCHEPDKLIVSLTEPPEFKPGFESIVVKVLCLTCGSYTTIEYCLDNVSPHAIGEKMIGKGKSPVQRPAEGPKEPELDPTPAKPKATPGSLFQ